MSTILLLYESDHFHGVYQLFKYFPQSHFISLKFLHPVIFLFPDSLMMANILNFFLLQIDDYWIK